jgi:hypothetical protein
VEAFRELPMVNGYTFCNPPPTAVFPVPISSVAGSIWGPMLSLSVSDLRVDPYQGHTASYSDLLDLMLPPVDANYTKPWPRPPAYYEQKTNKQKTTLNMLEEHKKEMITAFKECFNPCTLEEMLKGETKEAVIPDMNNPETAAALAKNPSYILTLRNYFPSVNINNLFPENSGSKKLTEE